MRRATAALVSGVLLSAGVPAGWLLSDGGSPPEYGQAVARSLRERPAPVTAPVLRPPTPTRAGPAVRTTSARAADVLVRPDPPAAVRFAGRRAAVDAVGLDDARRVVVPADVRRAGWYEPGPAPGDRTGSAVLVGHVDDRDQGLGTFAGLRDLRAGDGVVVETESGRSLGFTVVSLEQLPKAEVPMARLFTRDGPHRLVLISCAGRFDERTGSYADNLVVTAVPR